MAEKNTLSILETIKKKMNKFDQKSDKGGKISDINEEFQYISSSAPKQIVAKTTDIVAKEESSTVVAQTSVAEFGDGLDLGALEDPAPIPVKPVPKKSSNSHEHILDDFNLDDLDLDEEPKAPIAQPVKEKEVRTPEDGVEEGEFDEDDIEDYEDEVDFDEEGETEEMAEIEDNTLVVENELHDESDDDLDWLGNKKDANNETEEESEVDHDLDFPEEAETKEDDGDLNLEEGEEFDLNEDDDSDKIEEVEKVEDGHDDLDLEDLDLLEDDSLKKDIPKPIDHSANEDDLDFDDLDLLEDDSSEKENPKPIAQGTADDDLDFDDLDLSENDSPEKKAPNSQNQIAEDDYLDFDDLDSEEELEMVKEENKLPEVSDSKPQENLKNLKDVEDFLKPEPVAEVKNTISLEEEIDLEFDKEIMGLKPEVIQKIEQPINQTTQQIIPQMIASQQFDSLQNDIFAINQSVVPANFETKNPTTIINDSTLRQTNDSIKKLIDAKNIVSGIVSFSQGSAFGELAAQLMEPKLEKWLNEHLPDLVEKIVREEIKKIIPKE